MSRVNGIFDWINIGGQVVDLAGSIAGLFGENRDKSRNGSTEYDLGLLKFGVNSKNQFYAVNECPQPVILTCCQTRQDGMSMVTAASSNDISPQSGMDITYLLNEFQAGGRFVISPVSTDPTSNTPGQTCLSFAVKALSLSTAIVLSRGIDASVSRSEDGRWKFHMATSQVAIQSASVTITDANGFSVKGTYDSQRADFSNDEPVDIFFPQSLVLSPMIAQLDVTVMVLSESVRLDYSKCMPIADLRI